MKKADYLPLSFYVQILICSTLWGSAFPVIKISFSELNLETYSEQLVFAGSRFLLAGLMIVPFCRRSIIPSIRKGTPWKVGMIVLGQTFFQYVFFYYGLRVSSGTLGALLVGTGSFWWILLGPIILKTPKPDRWQWLILGISSIGIALAVYAPGAGSGNALIGSIAFLCASLSGAVAAIYMKQVAPVCGSRTTTAFSLFTGGVMLLVVAVAGWESYLGKFSFTTLWVTAYLAFVSAVAFTLWNRMVEKYSVEVLSTYRFLIPLCGVVESTLFIKEETMGMGIVVGGVMILACLIITSKRNKGV
ncbi:MAG: DMT family transporter [Opitutales bacterium]|nr:DMT family transporter [Opitutales bacterium]